MKSGLHQGRAMSSLLFVIVVEVLATMIRKSNNIHGIQMGEYEHKIVQYADDATICVCVISLQFNMLFHLFNYSANMLDGPH